jgi:tyrosinase
MLAIIREFNKSLQPKYLAAAKAFRFPYWDYFRPRGVDARFPGIKLEGLRTRYDYDFRMPDIFNVRDVMVQMPPNDNLEIRSNPLYTFKFTDKLNLDKDWARAKLRVSKPVAVPED